MIVCHPIWPAYSSVSVWPRTAATPLPKVESPLLLGDAASGGSNNILGMNFVGTSRTAAAAEQALAQVLEDLGFQTDFPFQHRVGQSNLATGNPAFTLFGTEHRTVGTTGTALDALFDFFAIIFEVF